eukprot:TRINITY_DN122359_c0_g1_i1.p1 TRINITY_DN122359_c0_g1~~TRINITY_DN122359_c0_g1_i1.p1  ORF type:complete len:606 (-),score=118.24 TRINITY_DN122359_c0_g1_i1:128-1945(-)
MPVGGVFGLLGLSSEDAAAESSRRLARLGGEEREGRIRPQSGKIKDVKLPGEDMPAAAAQQPRAAPGSIMMMCHGCGEMRKTQQGLCAACFLSGGAAIAVDRPSPTNAASTAKLPSLTNDSRQDQHRRTMSPRSLSTVRQQAGRGLMMRSSTVTDMHGGRHSHSDTPEKSLRPSSPEREKNGSSGLKAGSIGEMIKQRKQIIRDPTMAILQGGPDPKAKKEEEDIGIARLLQSAKDRRAQSPEGGRPKGSGFHAHKEEKEVKQSRSAANLPAPDDRSHDRDRGKSKHVDDRRPDPREKDRHRDRDRERLERHGGEEAPREEKPSQRSHTMEREKEARSRPGTMTEPALAGGYRRGDLVLSLISRMRHGLQVLELGHEGVVVGSCGGSSSSSAGGYSAKNGAPTPSARGAPDKLLVQFHAGFDWVLAPHQVCHKSQFQTQTANGLPGGFKWGDQVRSLEARLQPRLSRRGLNLGEAGTVIGPGALQGKIAVRFDGSEGGEWSLWPNEVCKNEAYEAIVSSPLAGGLRRGDRIKAKAIKANAQAGGPIHGDDAVEDGHEGTVIGPGHVEGRLMIFFDGAMACWSVDVNMIYLPGSGSLKKKSRDDGG